MSKRSCRWRAVFIAGTLLAISAAASAGNDEAPPPPLELDRAEAFEHYRQYEKSQRDAGRNSWFEEREAHVRAVLAVGGY
ncbi:MAG: hypothetical protein OEZ06_03270 [Myxococcales bacterium]|nr:hypothetical protein [Myxococcales bacterium]